VVAGMLAGFSALRAQTADDIMDKHQKAIGSADTWNNIKTVKMDGSMNIQGMDINITQTMAMGKGMRMDISAMGMNGYTIVTKTQGWVYMPFQGMTKIDTMKPDMVKAYQPQLELKGTELLRYKENGTKAEYIGKDTLSNVLCYKVKFTDKDGNESTSFFDASTYYLLRTESIIKQDGQEQEVVIGYNNYKKMDEGIVMPMTVLANGNEINFKTIELNKPVDDNIFIPGDSKTGTDTEPKK
jgi:hypothetical protein